MKRFPTRVLPVLLVMTCLMISACSASTAGTSTTSATPTQGSTTPNPAATVAKPTSVPTLTAALCQQMLSISDANQILNPPNPVAAVVPDDGATASSRNYIYGQNGDDLLLYFEAYPGGQLSQLAQMATNAAADGQLKSTTLTANQVANGIGDQAWFIAGTATDSGFSAHADVLYVVDSAVAFCVMNITYNGVNSLGSASDTTLESEFEQIAPMVIKAL